MPIKSLIFFLLSLLFHINTHGQDFEIINNDVTQVFSSLNHAVFLNDSTGFAVGGFGFGAGVIIKTTDYGNTWARIDVERNLFQVYFVNEIIGYAVGEGATIMKTIDGGESWEYQNADIVSSAFQFRTVVFLNPDTGFVGTANGPGYAFLKTYNGGTTWNNHLDDTIYVRSRLQSFNNDIVYGIGHSSQFYKTINSGLNWSEVSLPENTGQARDMYFINPDTGIVATRDFSSSCGSNYNYYFSRTSDGGENWTTQYFECENFSSFNFPTYHVGFARGTYWSNTGIRTMWRTIDSGENWEELEYPVGDTYFNTSCMITCFACVNQDTCYMPTNYGTIIKMTNATGGLVSTNNEAAGKSNSFQVFPNPNTGEFSIDHTSISERIIRVTIYAMDGRTVHDGNILNPNEEIRLSAGNIATGMYVISIFTKDQIYSAKFIKQ